MFCFTLLTEEYLTNLLSQLAGGCKDQSLTMVDFGVNLLQDGNGESCRLSSSRLRLGDNIASTYAWNDRTLLDSRRLLETIGVDSSQQFLVEIHLVEAGTYLRILKINH
jgi:hypothetical protein